MITDRLLKPSEVARILKVDPKTVTRWCSSAPPKLRSIRTPGGHRRIYSADVEKILSEGGND
jgi:excisionase family DNA binding protein